MIILAPEFVASSPLAFQVPLELRLKAMLSSVFVVARSGSNVYCGLPVFSSVQNPAFVCQLCCPFLFVYFTLKHNFKPFNIYLPHKNITSLHDDYK